MQRFTKFVFSLSHYCFFYKAVIYKILLAVNLVVERKIKDCFKKNKIPKRNVRLLQLKKKKKDGIKKLRYEGKEKFILKLPYMFETFLFFLTGSKLSCTYMQSWPWIQ